MSALSVDFNADIGSNFATGSAMVDEIGKGACVPLASLL
jgi:hypothetical protein